MRVSLGPASEAMRAIYWDKYSTRRAAVLDNRDYRVGGPKLWTLLVTTHLQVDKVRVVAPKAILLNAEMGKFIRGYSLDLVCDQCTMRLTAQRRFWRRSLRLR